MVTASGPTGILAGRPTATTAQSQQQNGTHDSQNNRTIDDDDRRRHESDLYVRPSWADAEIALDQIIKVCFHLWCFIPTLFTFWIGH